MIKQVKRLILLVGKTGVGKDTVADLLPFEKVISYTTRPKREKELNGVKHWFVSEEEMDCIEKRDDIIAWTKIGDIRYCALASELGDSVTIYIINPDGVRWFRNNYMSKDIKINLSVIGLTLSDEEQQARVSGRNDDLKIFEKRREDEANDFKIFEDHMEYDLLINNKKSFKTASIINNYIRNEVG